MSHRINYNRLWWLNDYRFEWDVDTGGGLQNRKKHDRPALYQYTPLRLPCSVVRSSMKKSLIDLKLCEKRTKHQ
jgi:hypothetical protein